MHQQTMVVACQEPLYKTVTDLTARYYKNSVEENLLHPHCLLKRLKTVLLLDDHS